jgi:hypothetical protein
LPDLREGGKITYRHNRALGNHARVNSTVKNITQRFEWGKVILIALVALGRGLIAVLAS